MLVQASKWEFTVFGLIFFYLGLKWYSFLTPNRNFLLETARVINQHRRKISDKEVEDLSPYDEGTDEGPSASNSAHLREWESDHDISSDSSLEILDVKSAFKYQKVQYVGSDSSDSESKEGIEKNSQISTNPFKE